MLETTVSPLKRSLLKVSHDGGGEIGVKWGEVVKWLGGGGGRDDETLNLSASHTTQVGLRRCSRCGRHTASGTR